MWTQRYGITYIHRDTLTNTVTLTYNCSLGYQVTVFHLSPCLLVPDEGS